MKVAVRRILLGTDAGASDMAAAFAIREEVFVEEQGVTLEEEHDGLDAAATTAHVLAVTADGEPVGTARLLTDPQHPGVVHVGRVAVRRSGRGLGVGRALMAALEAIALAEHAVPDGDGNRVRMELSAQETAIPFYSALGYDIASERYLDARIWHRDASKELRGHAGHGLNGGAAATG